MADWAVGGDTCRQGRDRDRCRRQSKKNVSGKRGTQGAETVAGINVCEWEAMARYECSRRQGYDAGSKHTESKRPKVSEKAQLKSPWHELIQMASSESPRVELMVKANWFMMSPRVVVPMHEQVCCPSQRPEDMSMAPPYEDRYELHGTEALPRDARIRLVRLWGSQGNVDAIGQRFGSGRQRFGAVDP